MKNKYLILSPILAFLILFLLPVVAHAAVVINEFSSPTSNDDWVELYNSDSTAVELSQFKLVDSTSTIKQLDGSIAGTGYAVVEVNNRLGNSGDTVKLLLVSDDSTIDQVKYGSGESLCAPSGNQTIGRSSDGGSSYTLFLTGSKGSSNNGAQTTSCPAPTPTPTPSPSPTPVNSPTPTPTPKATPTPSPAAKAPSPSPKVSPKASPKASPSEEPDPSSDDILGANSVKIEGNDSGSASNSSSSSADLKSHSKLIGIAMIVIGLSISAVGGFFLYKQALKNEDAPQNLV